MDAITYTPIGVVHSPFTTLEGMPLQTAAAQGIPGTVDLEPAFRKGLQDLEAFSHLILLTHLHRMTGYALEVTPTSMTIHMGYSQLARHDGRIRSACRWCGSSPSRKAGC